MLGPICYGVALFVLLSLNSALAKGEVLRKEANDNVSGILIKPFLRVPLLSLQLTPYRSSDNQADEESVSYKPNVNPDVGIAIDFGDFELAMSLPLPMDEDDLREKGQTRYQDYKLSSLRESFGFQIGYQRYKGFYREEGSTDVEELGFSRSPDLEREGYYGRVFWMPKTFHPHQVKNSWTMDASPLVGASVDALQMITRETVIPGAQFALYGDDSDLRGAAMETYSILFGGVGKIQRDAWLGRMLIYFGRGAQFRRLRFDDDTRQNGWQNAGKFGFHLESEYVVGSFVYGLEMLFDIAEMKLADSIVESTVGSVLVSIGTRLPFAE